MTIGVIFMVDQLHLPNQRLKWNKMLSITIYNRDKTAVSFLCSVKLSFVLPFSDFSKSASLNIQLDFREETAPGRHRRISYYSDGKALEVF
jgi:hypothetical protein